MSDPTTLDHSHVDTRDEEINIGNVCLNNSNDLPDITEFSELFSYAEFNFTVLRQLNLRMYSSYEGYLLILCPVEMKMIVIMLIWIFLLKILADSHRDPSSLSCIRK